MGYLFTKDPVARERKNREWWLQRLPDEAHGVATALLADLPLDWKLGTVDRERFSTSGAETYGVAVAGPDGELRCGVGVTKADAVAALHARLGGWLQPTPVWVPPLAANLSAASHGSLEQLEAQGWEIHLDSETYSAPPVRVIGAVARREDESPPLLAVITGEQGREQARAALAELVAGRITPAEHWAPA